MRDGPDFICIGSQKAGTGSLYDILRGHRDCWMPPIKELEYFKNSGRPFVFKRIKRARRRLTQAEQRGVPVDPRDVGFIDAAEAAHHAMDRSISHYRSLFGMADSLTTGDITPAYSTLQRKWIAKIADDLPTTRILLVLRDPVSRLWSHARMQEERGSGAFTSDFAAFRAFCESPRVRTRSLQSRVYETWKERFGDRMYVLFFDDLRDNPGEFFSQVCRILGIRDDADLTSHPLNRNRKARSPAPFPAEMEAYAQQMLADEYDRLSRLVGGHATAWQRRFVEAARAE